MTNNVLFVCIHNSARSQMAEAFVNKCGEGKMIAESAGIKPGVLNPLAVQVMSEIGYDISANQTKSCQEFLDANKQFDFVITVCDEANALRCPVFPGSGARLHFDFKDPSTLDGGDEEKLIKTREIRDQIKEKMENWLKVCEVMHA